MVHKLTRISSCLNQGVGFAQQAFAALVRLVNALLCVSSSLTLTLVCGEGMKGAFVHCTMSSQGLDCE